MQQYYPPAHRVLQFHCIHCGVYAAQTWETFLFRGNDGSLRNHKSLDYCVCSHCGQWSYWFQEKMVVPSEAPVPTAHPDMPPECQVDYDEARSIVAVSPRAASALLRLALQKLMPVLGEKGKNINEDIGNLVKKGLPLQVQKALDFCRVVGNNAVHPGEIDLNDTPEIAHNIFVMMNFIVDDRITRPKTIEALYSKLPESARKAVEARDSGKP